MIENFGAHASDDELKYLFEVVGTNRAARLIRQVAEEHGQSAVVPVRLTIDGNEYRRQLS